MKRIAIIATILLLVLATGCKSTRRTKKTSSTTTTTVVTKPSADKGTQASKEYALFSDMIESYGDWETCVARGSISLGSLSSSFEMRMIKDEGVQISLRPIFGIEIARLIIKGDKLYIYDKINSRYIENSLSDFSNIVPFTPTVSDVQNIFLGRPFILGENNLEASDYKKFNINIAGNDWTLQPKKKTNKIDYMFAMNREQTESLQASQTNTGRKITCNYKDYQNDITHQYPSTIQVQAQTQSKKYAVKISYSTVTWNSSTTIQQLSTRGYSKTTLSKVIDSLL